MIVRLIFNYIKKQKMKKELQLLEEELKNHSIYEPDPVPEEKTKTEEIINNDIDIRLNLIDSIDVNINNSTYTISLEHESKDWEDDDILLSKTPSSSVFIHPWTFLKYTIDSECQFIKNQDNDFLKTIENSNWFKFTYLEDSRDYPSITIEKQPTVIKCHYLCPMFYIANINEKIILVVDNLYDENMDEIPKIFTTISSNLFDEASAAFDVEDEMWENTNA